MFIPSSWSETLQTNPKQTNINQTDVRSGWLWRFINLLSVFIFHSTVVQKDGTMPDTNLDFVHQVTGVNPAERDSTQKTGESDSYGWITYTKETVSNGFQNIYKTMGRIGYITFRLLPRTAYAASRGNVTKTNLNTSDKMLARLFVKKNYRRQFLNRLTKAKKDFPDEAELIIYHQIYNQMGAYCFTSAKFVIMQNEFAYDTNFQSHILCWVNPFTNDREKISVVGLFLVVLSILLSRTIGFWDKIRVIKSIYFLENCPVARSIRSIRHFHIFLDGLTIDDRIYIY